MKILHTADWHAGRSLKGIDRTPEIRAALIEIANLAIEENVDLILVAGDLFDKKNPSAEAEAAVYEFFLKIGEAKIPSVVIAGNHDAPSRLDAAAGVLALTNAKVFGLVKVAQDGGCFDMQIGNEVARIAALPFVSERRIVRVSELIDEDAGQWVQKYRKGMRTLINNLCQSFDNQHVNILMLHTTTEGASLARSEYSFHCTDDYTISADMLPENANYIAVGHIHKPQGVDGFPENTARYSGSLIQLDFGEAGDEKYVYIVEAAVGKPTKLIKEYVVQSGKELKQITIDVDKTDLDKKLKTFENFEGWLKIVLKVKEPKPGLKDRIKAQLPQALAIEFEFPDREVSSEEREAMDVQQINLSDAYERYYSEDRGGTLPKKVLAGFRDLLADVEADKGPSL